MNRLFIVTFFASVLCACGGGGYNIDYGDPYIGGGTGGTTFGGGGYIENNWAGTDGNGKLYRFLFILDTDANNDEVNFSLQAGEFNGSFITGSYLEIFDLASYSAGSDAYSLSASFQSRNGEISIFDESGNNLAELSTLFQNETLMTVTPDSVSNSLNGADFNIDINAFLEEFSGALVGLEDDYNFSLVELLDVNWADDAATPSQTLEFTDIQTFCNSDNCFAFEGVYGHDGIDEQVRGIVIGDSISLYSAADLSEITTATVIGENTIEFSDNTQIFRQN